MRSRPHAPSQPDRRAIAAPAALPAPPTHDQKAAPLARDRSAAPLPGLGRDRLRLLPEAGVCEGVSDAVGQDLPSGGTLRLSLRQRGRDTERIDLLYRIHYLQWTGIPNLDRLLGALALTFVLALTLLGLRLALRRA